MRESFITSCLKNGVSRKIADKVFEQLAAFAAYGFCKAHAVAYAVLAYQTLWLKYHYPTEFFAAVLSNQPMGYYPPQVLVDEAKRAGVKVLPPDVNHSFDHYTVENGAIRVSLRQLKGISEDALTSILSARAQGGFTSVRDFILRTNVGWPTIESLARVGAFDSLDSREEVFSQLPKLSILKRRAGRATRPLFEEACEESDTVPETTGDAMTERMLAERELLSLNLTAHPIDVLYADNGLTRMKDLGSVATGETVTIAGSVIRYQTPPTRNGNRVMYVIMEDGTGIADVTVFGDVQEKCGPVLFRESWLKVIGVIQRIGPKALSIIAKDLTPLR